MYLMAIGSPTHPITPASWDALQRPIVQFGGIDYISGVAPIFIHQYGQAWCDYRDVRDKHANYFTNSIAATRAHQLWCLDAGQKFPWIDQDLWGISASDSRSGYRVWGGPPTMGRRWHTGAMCVCGFGGISASGNGHVLLTMRERYKERVDRDTGSWTRSIRRKVVCRRCDRDRCGGRPADGGEPADRFGVGALHEESGNPARDAGVQLPSRSGCEYPGALEGFAIQAETHLWRRLLSPLPLVAHVR